MTLVRIVKAWQWPDLMRQTPRSMGIWDGIRFTLEPATTCDYVIVLNNAPKDTIVTVECPSNNIWAIIQEPPNEYYRQMHFGIEAYRRVYNQDVALMDERYLLSQPALPWHVNKDYDFLIRAGIPRKEKDLSWITSNAIRFSGHRDRMRFLKTFRNKMDFDLYGKGFTYIEDKWDGIAPYRYSIAVENYQNPYYWSEKIADCFLAWSMPVYFGCTRITDYFPPESMIQIDIHDRDVADRIQEAIADDRWRKNLDAVAAARELVLNKYQFFPFVAEKIRRSESGSSSMPERITFKGGYEVKPSSVERSWRTTLLGFAGRLKRLFSRG